MAVQKTLFGYTEDQKEIYAYTLTNESGMKAEVISFGAVLTKLYVKDQDNQLVDVVLGFEDPKDYLTNPGCLGATVGRHANRIAGAAFSLNGREYKLPANDGVNNLHSNPGSYYFRLWESEITADNGVAFSLESPDGDQGYPGNFKVTVTYTLTEENGLVISYDMISDADTLANMTNHSYFNLSGHDSGNILDQEVQIDAAAYTPSDAGLIPTGEIRKVAGTPFDFNSFKTIGQDIQAEDPQLVNGGGYDHNFVLNNNGAYARVAAMYSPKTGVMMDVYTDLPGMQLYTANTTQLSGGKGGCQYGQYSAACFETQFFPDGIHHENFPSCVLKANTPFKTVTEYRFSVK